MSPFFSNENFPTFKKILRVLKALGKGFLVLLIIGAVAHSIASVILGQRLKAELAKLKATGVPVSMAELGKPKIPDAENAAVIYAKVFKDYTGMVLNPNVSKLSMPLIPVADLGKPKLSDTDVIKVFIDAKPGERSPEMWDAARKVVAKHKNILPLLKEATSRPKCQFPVNWEDGPSAIFPHYAPMKKLSQFICANTLIEAHAGRMDEAIQSIELGFKVSELLKDDPIIIGQLIRVAMIKITSKSLRETLEHGSINEAQARRLYDILAQIDMYPGFDKAMLGERCCCINIFDLIRKEPSALWWLSNTGNGGCTPPDNKIIQRVIVGIWRPFLYADEMFALKFWDKQIELMRLPYREMYPRRSALDIEDSNPFYTFPLAPITCPVFMEATSGRDAASAEVAACRIILILQVYKGRYGAYPASPDELRTKIGWNIPKDVFSDKDFIYKRQGNGFLFYSIGQNLKDDRAVFLTVSPLPEGYRYKNMDGKYTADIIWQMDH